MKKIILIALVVVAACGTHKKKFSTHNELCNTLIGLHFKDQEYRGLEIMQDPFFGVLDSLIGASGMSRQEYTKVSREEQLDFGRRAKAISENMDRITKSEEDSLMRLQQKLDIENTKTLIAIVKERGFPNMQELNCNGYAAPFLVFGHAPEKFWPEIDKLIEKEKKKGRIGEGDYKYIKWHINGRKGTLGKGEIQIGVN